jgi:NAD(P)-dependent dehydrogenase (short-subunit alcohol dehydrogenase family)
MEAGKDLAMKTVFITGVGKGLGRELLKKFALKKHNVFGLLRNPEELSAIQKEHPLANLLLADVGMDQCIQVIRDCVGDTPVDLIINNAGISGKGIRLGKVDPAQVNEVFNVHCTGALRVIKALEANLLSSQDPYVVNISSRMGSVTSQAEGKYKDLEVSYSYRIAKAAQNMLTVSLRNEFGNKIKFISLHPGKMKTRKAQTDADIEPSESAERLIRAWETGQLKVTNGILELPSDIISW